MFRAGRKLPVKRFLSIAADDHHGPVGRLPRQRRARAAEYRPARRTSLIGVVPRLPHLLADLTGIHPTVETLAAQLLLAVVYASGLVALRRQAAGAALRGRAAAAAGLAPCAAPPHRAGAPPCLSASLRPRARPAAGRSGRRSTSPTAPACASASTWAAPSPKPSRSIATRCASCSRSSCRPRTTAEQGVALGVAQALQRLLASPALCRFQPRVWPTAPPRRSTRCLKAILPWSALSAWPRGGPPRGREAHAHRRYHPRPRSHAAYGLPLPRHHRWPAAPRRAGGRARPGRGGRGRHRRQRGLQRGRQRAMSGWCMGVARELGLPATGGPRSLRRLWPGSAHPDGGDQRQHHAADAPDRRAGGGRADQGGRPLAAGRHARRRRRDEHGPVARAPAAHRALRPGGLARRGAALGRVLDGIFLEVGGTSTNLGVIRAASRR